MIGKLNPNNRRVIFVFSHDSFYRGSLPIAESFRRLGYDVGFIQLVLNRTESNHSLFQPSADSERIPTVEGERIADFFAENHDTTSAYYLNLPGNHLEHFRRAYRAFLEIRSDTTERAFLLGGFNGVLSYKKLFGFYVRSFLDLFHLNTVPDLRYFEDLLASFDQIEGKPKLICSGIPMLDWAKAPENSDQERKDFLFACQPNVPSKKAQRMEVVEKLCRIAEKHPDARVVIKPRVRKTETTFHPVDFHYEDLLEELSRWRPIPPNLSISHDDIRSLIPRAQLVISVCSTALLEAACLGVPILSMSDFGVSDALGNTFFIGSGALCSLEAFIRTGEIPRLREEFYRDSIYVTRSSSDLIASESHALIERGSPGPMLSGIPEQLGSSLKTLPTSFVRRLFKRILTGRHVAALLKRALRSYRALRNS